MGASQVGKSQPWESAPTAATNTAIAAAASTSLPKISSASRCTPGTPCKADASNDCAILRPKAVQAEDAPANPIGAPKKCGGKLHLRRLKLLSKPGKERKFSKKAMRHPGSQQLLCHRPALTCPRKPQREKEQPPQGRFRPAHRTETSDAAPPIQGILRTPSAARAAAASRRAPWWMPSVLKRARGQRLTFGKTICVTEFSRSLGDGVPSEGDIAVGLGRPIATTQEPLTKSHRRWKEGEELPIVLAECRADVIKEWMGAGRFDKVAEDHERETARIRQSRKDSMEEGKDVTMMPVSLAEARDRALKVSKEAAEAAMELTAPILVFSNSPQKRKFEDTKSSSLKGALLRDDSSPRRKRAAKSVMSDSLEISIV